MTKQEELRKAIDIYTDDGCLYLSKGCEWCSGEGYCSSDSNAYTCLMKRFTELGVVLKVDREVPYEVCQGCTCYFLEKGKAEFAEKLKKAGYVAVKPLIKEE